MSTAETGNLITDIPGIRVGNAVDERVMTGTSVIVCDRPAVAAAVVAGGGPGTRETDLLAADTLVDSVDAIVLSGGSAYGLAAADGVAAALGAAGRGFGFNTQPGIPKTPIVPAAILYDLANGGDKAWGDTPPYATLGKRALADAGRQFTIGRAGAGYGAQAGCVRGGLGSASVGSDDGLCVGALVAVNCFGSVYMPGTDVFWAHPFETGNEFGGKCPPADYKAIPDDWGASKARHGAGQNTTIACVATDTALTPGEASRLARMALSGFSRAIRPVFTPFDGDVIFVISTAKKPLADPGMLTLARLGELAAGTLARAVARGVWAAR